MRFAVISDLHVRIDGLLYGLNTQKRLDDVLSDIACKSSKDHSKPRNEVDTSLKSPV
ncbi:hypothetical protein GPK52_01355 [Sutterella wadsworthensis]|nr:hypothetical protein [Sutterella wadsworthensis]